MQLRPFFGRELDPNIQANVNRCKIPQERLTLGVKIGKGNFGLVYKAQLITPAGNLRTVAVKTLKGKTSGYRIKRLKIYFR